MNNSLDYCDPAFWCVLFSSGSGCAPSPEAGILATAVDHLSVRV